MLTYHPFTFLLFNLLVVSLPFANSYVFTGTEIRDLFKKGENFAQDALLWDASKTSSTEFTSVCADYYPVVGGQNILGDPTTHLSLNEYFFRTYTGLPTHSVIYYTITLYALDQWNKIPTNGDGFNLKFDSTTVSGFVTINSNRFYESIGGNPNYNDLRNLRVFGRVAHVPTSLTLQIISLLNDVNTLQSFGFREINLIFDNPGTVPANSICGTGPAQTTFSEACYCDEGQYGTSSCTNCNAACSSCWGAGASNCYQCAPGYSWISGACTQCSAGCTACHGTAYNQCDDCRFGLFLINNQCVNTCPLPLIPQVINSVTQCVTPCTLTQYVYWDGSCNSTCSAPLQPFTLFDNILTCKFPCADGQFLYSNGVCAATCTSPLLPVAQNGQQMCLTPCASGEYLYPDSTCSAICDFPMTFELTNGVLYCRYTCTGTNFLYWDQVCRGTCAFPLTKRFEWGGLRFCDFPLADTTQYLYYDGTGGDSCPMPYTATTLGVTVIRNFCNYNCNPLTQYLYWDQSCQTSCNSPLVETSNGIYRFCNYPCALTGEFLYFNGTCSTSCPTVDFNQRTTYSVQFCDDKCPTGQYQYWDNACLPTCDSGLTIYTGGAPDPALFCVYPCASGTEYLYWNGTCNTNCDFPLTQSVFKGEQFCNYKCGENEYLYYNGSCSLNCPLPYAKEKNNDKGFCNFPCSLSEYLFWNGSCLADCPSPLTIEADPLYGYYCKTPCPSPFQFYIPETKQCVTNCKIFPEYQEELYQICLPAGADQYEGLPNLFLLRQEARVSMLTTAKLSRYIEILQIPRTTRLKYFLENRGVNLLYFKLGKPMSEKKILWFDYHQVDDRFTILSMHSNFIVNDWRSLLPIFWSLVATVSIYLLHYICQSCKFTTFEPYLRKLKMIAFLNLMFIMVVVNIDDSFVFGLVFYMSMELNSRSEALGFFAATSLMFLLPIAILITTVVLVHKYQKVKKEAIETHRFDNYVKFLTKYQSCHVLYRGYREEKKVQQLFFLIYVVRVSLPVILGFIFLNFPNPQTFFQLIISIAMITYMLYFDPVKSRINTVQLLIMEGATLIINLAAFFTAMFDAGGLESGRAYVLLGDFIVGGNVFMNVATWVLFPVKIGFEIRRILKIKREKRQTHNSIWLNLVAIFVQQQAFGFEELIEDPQLAKETLMLSRDVSSEMWAKHLRIQHKRPKELVPLSSDGTLSGTPDFDMTSGSFQNSPVSSKADEMSPGSGLLRKKFDFTPLRKSRLSTHTTGWRSSTTHATPMSPLSAAIDGVEDVILEKTNEEESKTVQDPFRKARGQEFEDVDLNLKKTGSTLKQTEDNNEAMASNRKSGHIESNFNREHTPLAAWIRKPPRSRFTLNTSVQTPPRSSRGEEDVSLGTPWKEGGSFAGSSKNFIDMGANRSQVGFDTTANHPRDSQFVEHEISPNYNGRRSLMRRSHRGDTFNHSLGRGSVRPEDGSTAFGFGSHTERTEDDEPKDIYRL